MFARWLMHGVKKTASTAIAGRSAHVSRTSVSDEPLRCENLEDAFATVFRGFDNPTASDENLHATGLQAGGMDHQGSGCYDSFLITLLSVPPSSDFLRTCSRRVACQ